MKKSSEKADFLPKGSGLPESKFRFWCQKVLPLVYDDSLSYYELLSKVIEYLNNTITDVATAETNISKLLGAYNSLQKYVNDETNDMFKIGFTREGLWGDVVDIAQKHLISPSANYDTGDLIIDIITGTIYIVLADADQNTLTIQYINRFSFAPSYYYQLNITSDKKKRARLNMDAEYSENIARKYNPNSTYQAGDFCEHEGYLHRALVDIPTPESYDPEKWEQVTLTSVMNTGGGGKVTPASIVTATSEMTAEQKAQTRENIGAGTPITPQQIADGTGAWLEDNLATPSTPPIDSSLSVANAAADAKAVGDKVGELKNKIDSVTTIGAQIFNKNDAETELLVISNNAVYASSKTTSVIIPVNPSASDEHITVHRETITSRFTVATFTTKPEAGSVPVASIQQDNASSITIACSTAIKYIMVVFHHATDDASITIQNVLDGLMVEFGASYTGYEPYSLRVIIPTKSVDGDSFSDDGIRFITDIVDAKTEDVQTLADANKHQTFNKADVTLAWTEGSYYNLTTGEITALSGRAYSAKVDCKAGDRISVTNNKGQILYWKADGSFLSYSATDYPSSMTYVVPANVTKFAFNNSDSTIRASIATVRTDGSELIAKTYNAPARLIFDSDAFEQGKYCSTTNGKISAVASYWCLPFVPVKPNHKYRTEDQTQIVFYNSSGAFLSALLPNGSASWTGVDTEMDFTTPSNCAFISVNAQNSHEKLFDVEPYTVIGNVINPQKLQGKTVVCFGDSITGNYGFGDNYPYQIERHTGAKTYNCGFGGCRMELIDSDALHTNPFSMCGIADALEADKNGDATAWDEQDEYAESISKMVYLRLQILKAIDWSKVDIVTIAYGTNEGGYPQDDEENPTNKYTYGGATRYAVNKLLTLYPHLRIVLLTPIYRFYTSEGVDSDTHTHPTYGGKLTDNVETLIKVGGELKIPVLDLYHTLGINITNYTSYFGDEDELSDGTHINSFGREQMGRRVAGELMRLV